MAVIVAQAGLPAKAYPANAAICVKSQMMHLFGGCGRPVREEPANERMSAVQRRSALLPRFAPGARAGIGNIRMNHYASYGRSGGPAVFLQLESKPAADGSPVRLVMRCMDDETNLLFEFPGRHMSDIREKSELFYSVDGSDQKIVELSLATGEADSVMGIWHGYRAIGFLKTLAGGTSLQMDAWDRDNNHFRVGFDISNLERALQPLRETCGW